MRYLAITKSQSRESIDLFRQRWLRFVGAVSMLIGNYDAASDFGFKSLRRLHTFYYLLFDAALLN